MCLLQSKLGSAAFISQVLSYKSNNFCSFAISSSSLSLQCIASPNNIVFHNSDCKVYDYDDQSLSIDDATFSHARRALSQNQQRLNNNNTAAVPEGKYHNTRNLLPLTTSTTTTLQNLWKSYNIYLFARGINEYRVVGSELLTSELVIHQHKTG